MMILGLLQNEPSGDPAGFLDALRPLDQVGLGLVALFLLLGALRGLWWQVIRLAGLLFAGLLARTFAPRWAPAVADASGLPALASQGLVWFGVFVLALAGASLFGLIGKKSLDTMQLGLVDRAGGGLVGVATGLFLHAALLLGLTYLGPQPWTSRQLEGTRSQALLRLVSLTAPVLLDRESEAAREIREWLGTGEALEPAPAAPEPPLLEAAPDGALEEPAGEGEFAAEARPVEASSPRVR